MKIFLIMTLFNSVVATNGPFHHGMAECQAALGIKKYEWHQNFIKKKSHIPNLKESDAKFTCTSKKNM